MGRAGVHRRALGVVRTPVIPIVGAGPRVLPQGRVKIR
jgi:hypothetical protein